MADIAVLIFLLQQLGFTLGLGAATFSLMFYVLGIADGAVDASEQRFIHATKTVLALSMFLIVLTGGLVTGAHILADEMIIVLAPVYLSKWILIGVVIVNGILLRFKAYSAIIGGIISGASWYALFIVHTLVPDVSWSVLGVGYALWLLIFALGFAAVHRGARSEWAGVAPTLKPKPQAPQPAPKVEQPHIPVSRIAYAIPQGHKLAPPIEFDLNKQTPSSEPRPALSSQQK